MVRNRQSTGCCGRTKTFIYSCCAKLGVALSVAVVLLIVQNYTLITTISLPQPAATFSNEFAAQERKSVLPLLRLLILKYCGKEDNKDASPELQSLSGLEQKCLKYSGGSGTPSSLCSHSDSLPQQMLQGEFNSSSASQMKRELATFVSKCSDYCAPFLRSSAILSEHIREAAGPRSGIILKGPYPAEVKDYIYAVSLRSEWPIRDRLVWLSSSEVDRKYGNVTSDIPLVRGLTCIVEEKPTHGPLAHFASAVLPYFDSKLPCQTYVFTKTPGSVVASRSTFYGLLTTLALNRHSKMVFLNELHGNRLTCFEHIARHDPSSNFFDSPEDALRFKKAAWDHLGFTVGPPRKVCLSFRSNGRNPLNFHDLFKLLEGKFGTVDILQFHSWMPIKTQAQTFYSCWLLVSPHGSHNMNLLFSQPASYFLEIDPPKFHFQMFEKLANKGGIHYLRTEGVAAERGMGRPWQHLSTAECTKSKECRSYARESPYRVNLTDITILLGNLSNNTRPTAT
eukprot:gb/GECG01010755.1/.p1 GENE.gb/GECG01010755.1/~~gb/GECG01010755.1/.p1  ORF type:complete len:509 (+),score=38.61 gb/GECG01010755.1/:1-1527(+)